MGKASKCTDCSLPDNADDRKCIDSSIRAPAVLLTTTFSTMFDFSSAASPGWSTGGGNPPYAFNKSEGGTSGFTGPSAGVNGLGYYYYARTGGGREEGDLFMLAYDGSICSAKNQTVGTVDFHYHMYGAGMGELRVTSNAGETLWSLNGNQGNAWNAVSVAVDSPSFAFEYTRGNSWKGHAAVALVTVTCAVLQPLGDATGNARQFMIVP